jgi:hypothetical protein
MHVKTRKLQPRLAARAAVVLALVGAGLAATATPSYAGAVTLSRATGPSGGGYTITLTGIAGDFDATTVTDVTVQFNVAPTCPGTKAAPAPLGTLAAGAVTTGVVETTVAEAAGTTLTVTVPAGMTQPAAATASKTFSVCVYDPGNADALLSNANAAFTLTADIKSDVTSGASGGGYPLTLTSTSSPFTAFNASAHLVQLQARTGTGPTLSTACATTAPGASAPTASSTTVMTGGVVTVPTTNVIVPSASKMTITVPPTLVQPVNPQVLSANYFICVYNAAGSTLLAQTAPADVFNLSGNVALSTSSGSSTGGNVVSITAGAPIFTSGSTAVMLSTATCASTYQTAAAGKVDVPNVRFISKNKLAATMPSLSAHAPGPTPLYACVYTGTNNGVSTLVAAAYGTYTVGSVPTIASVSPATGPAQGGTRITVTGTLFPTGPGELTATLAGEPLIDVQVANATTFTATTPPHAPGGPFAIAVTTVLGTQSTSGLFTYTNGIVVAPNTAPNTSMAPTDVDINGVGFSALKFSPTYSTNSSNAHVYLVRGVYNAGTATAATSVKPNPQVSECIDVLVVSDTNLICSLYLGGNLNAAPTATTRTVSSCASTNANGEVQNSAQSYLGPSSPTVTTCTFTQADVGMKITAGASGAAIADNTTTIISVSPQGIAQLSKASTTAVAAATTPISLSSQRTINDVTMANGATTLTSAAAPFNASDAGKMITGTNIPLGTYIASVSGNTATLSKAVTGAIAPQAVLTIFTPTAVPEGTYTMTVVSNGAPGASTITTIPYTQSIVSSGSTFTVAPY